MNLKISLVKVVPIQIIKLNVEDYKSLLSLKSIL